MMNGNAETHSAKKEPEGSWQGWGIFNRNNTIKSLSIAYFQDSQSNVTPLFGTS